MGIKSTKYIKKKNAIEYLERKGIIVFDNDCVERLQCILNENPHDDYSNYEVYERHDYDVIDSDKFAEWTEL